MGFDNTVTVVGNVTRDPELRFTQGGMAVANFGLAWNKRRKDGEEETSFSMSPASNSWPRTSPSPSPRARGS